MFGRNILILEAVSLLIGKVNNTFYTRGNENLPCPTAENISFRAGTQGSIETLDKGVWADIHFLQDLGDHTARLFD